MKLCQITTDYSYREFLDSNLKGSSTTEVDIFHNMLNKHNNEKYLIISLNTDNENYQFRELSFNKKLEKIEFKSNRKLSQYNLIFDGEPLFKVLYGKNQANAFQRGIWTNKLGSINYFPLIKKGRYQLNNYFEDVILRTINMNSSDLSDFLRDK